VTNRPEVGSYCELPLRSDFRDLSLGLTFGLAWMEVSEHLWLFSTLTLEIMVLIGLCSGLVESPMTFSLQCVSKAQQERTLISVWLTWLPVFDPGAMNCTCIAARSY